LHTGILFTDFGTWATLLKSRTQKADVEEELPARRIAAAQRPNRRVPDSNDQERTQLRAQCRECAIAAVTFERR
jgi:hypothetical protein